MRWAVALGFSICLAAQISAPRAGFSRLPDGTVRPVNGVAGAFAVGEPVLRGAVSFGFSGRMGVAKLDASVVVLDAEGSKVAETEAPGGRALVGFSGDGAAAVVAGAGGGWVMLCDADGCRRTTAEAPEGSRAAAIGRGGELLFATSKELFAYRPDRRRALRREPLEGGAGLLRPDGSAAAGGTDTAEWMGGEWASVRQDGAQRAWNTRSGAASPLNAEAGFTLWLWRGGVETEITDTVDLGSYPIGAAYDFRIRARNPGSAEVVIDYLPTPVQSPSKAFTYDPPSEPYRLAAGDKIDFFMSFAPTAPGEYKVVVKINGATVTIKATAVAPLFTAELELNGTSTGLGSGATVDFGKVLAGKSARRRIVLRNTGTAPLTVKSVSVAGGPFRTEDLATPANIDPASSAALTAVFEPTKSGDFSTTLTIDGLLLKLAGSAYDAPLPKPAVDAGTAAWSSGAQRTVAVRFGSAAQRGGTGTLKLEFKPSAAGATDDAGVQFATGGTRVQSFEFSEGDSAARFGGAKDVTVQTGTTAGTLVFTATVGSYVEQFSFRVAAAKVALDDVKAAKSTGNITITMTGYDNSRTAGSLAFTFYDQSGRPLGGELTADVAADFQKFFAAGAGSGGAFLMRAVFPVSGDISQVGAVDVRMANGIDATRADRVPVR